MRCTSVMTRKNAKRRTGRRKAKLPLVENRKTTSNISRIVINRDRNVATTGRTKEDEESYAGDTPVGIKVTSTIGFWMQ